MTNFKKIVDLLKKIQNKHLQLQGFGVGDINQLIYSTEERLKQENINDLSPYYPLMYVIPQEARSDRGQMVFSFDILVMDILNTKNTEIETDVWSDTLDILTDIVAQILYSIDNEYCDWDLETPVNYFPFSESFDDYVSGWTGRINIVVPRPIDLCIAPFSTFE